MKIQCNACGAAEAAVLCCADEAALCWACDERVHAANKLAGKHQRVPLLSDGPGGGGASSSRGVPKCDICQARRRRAHRADRRQRRRVGTRPKAKAHWRRVGAVGTRAKGAQGRAKLRSRECAGPIGRAKGAQGQVKAKATVQGREKGSRLAGLGEGAAAGRGEGERRLGNFDSNRGFRFQSGMKEASGYFFCLEDRALLCRKCDVAVHTVNPYVSAHQRFLLTGVRVGLDHTEPAASPLAGSQLHVSGRSVEPQSKQLPSISNPMSSLDTNGVVSSQMHEDGGLVASKAPISGFKMPGSILDWPLDEFFGFSEFNQNFGFTEQYSSKADSGKIGSSEGSSLHHITDDDVDAGECLGQLVPEIPWRVPEIPSPPTASGLSWQSIPHYSVSDAVFVPDISTSHDPTYFTQMPAKSHHRHRQRR